MATYNHPDEQYWNYNWEERCSECGKPHRCNKYYKYWFDTMDGGDSMTTAVCWKCTIHDWVYAKIKRPLVRRIRYMYLLIRKLFRHPNRVLLNHDKYNRRERWDIMKKLAWSDSAYKLTRDKKTKKLICDIDGGKY